MNILEKLSTLIREASFWTGSVNIHCEIHNWSKCSRTPLSTNPPLPQGSGNVEKRGRKILWARAWEGMFWTLYTWSAHEPTVAARTCTKPTQDSPVNISSRKGEGSGKPAAHWERLTANGSWGERLPFLRGVSTDMLPVTSHTCSCRNHTKTQCIMHTKSTWL